MLDISNNSFCYQDEVIINGRFKQYAVIEASLPIQYQLHDRMRSNELTKSNNGYKLVYAYYVMTSSMDNIKKHKVKGFEYNPTAGSLYGDFDILYEENVIFDKLRGDIYKPSQITFVTKQLLDGDITLRFVLPYNPTYNELKNNYNTAFIDKYNHIRPYYKPIGYDFLSEDDKKQCKDAILADPSGNPLQFNILKIYEYNKGEYNYVRY